ncbi:MULTISPECIES: betaine/proline/choline family ABC transporter ATP-binding protein [unclassified Streptomyces]|jgi:osmoprotectant transport system ATP-binding protein|uniref:betaine/proline/choline family ABC transporter ATP-binding protein n=1 Tax=unclassified Streptomyces TaxID=2593676 RepID=UPI0029A609F6|nr:MULTISPECIES: betaine/proline/choline family ABC transporter ATP-binding protein [unclassified Streptomyces]MDX3770186.1 betaine/proline/choline family ABC transporter ATP-binding protein [Streptomyces sp. AK08-01B]MDX3819457.1 betaine/proline/choline family ABC transporter ATP-binding protein [Streptomyces sp. AK08-01A]WSQ28899.1 betaine/proline/choline family ABC transporter ATP-binding protein [Streptomyces sp. NBC_01230]
MIRFEHVTKRYADGTTAVDDLSFDVAEGELVTLVGPSGCGKTTTMKMVNRLIEPTEGRIFLDGDDISAIDPVRLRRRIGYVIQQVGLFPHRTVLENTATVPHLLGWKRGKGRERAAELLDLVGLDPSVYGDRYPDQLSGGQRQRVGVARALAADPPVLLMDEPFGAVDPVVRERLQNEFLRLQAQVRKTVLFVTHDIEEAVRLGDRIAVYGQGSIEQFDSPATVLGAPATPYVADFVGADRGLKRLSVTPIEESDLDQPPVVHLDDPLSRATERLRAEGARWAVVLDREDKLHGWIPADTALAEAKGTVREHARRMEAWLPVGAPLKQAFATMLQHDAGWIAVIDKESTGRFLGVLTPARLHEALRRSIDADAQDVPRAEVAVETVATVARTGSR